MTQRSTERGFSLLEILMAGAIGTVVLGGIVYAVQSTFRHAARSEQRAELASFASLLTDQISCANTFDPAVNPDVAANASYFADCVAGSRPTKLYGKRGTTAPAPLIISNDPANPTRIGRWTIRAWCAGDRIVVDAAQPKGNGPNVLVETDPALFFSDPQQQGRSLDWLSVNDAQSRRVIKAASALCRTQFVGTVPSPTPGVTCPGCYPNRDCPDGSCFIVSGTLTAGADLPSACASNWAFVHWSGSASCPSGSQLMAGGVNCQVPGVTSSQGGGILLSAFPLPTAPFTTYFADCCGVRPASRPDAPPSYTHANSFGFAESWGNATSGPVYALCKRVQ